MIKKIILNANQWAKAVVHFSKLGKVASRRSFLHRERKKLLLKIGEKTITLVHSGEIQTPSLMALSRHLEKLDKLLQTEDYGGQQGISFQASKKSKAKKATKIKRFSRKKKKISNTGKNDS